MLSECHVTHRVRPAGDGTHSLAPMASAELLTFESYCETLYSSPSASERASAESALVQLSTAPEYIPRCQYVLSASQLPYAQLVASNALRCVPCTVQTRV